MKKIHITSLGCAKNLVDSEVLAGQLLHRNCELIANPNEADLIIINTCGFIEDAKKESIQAIFEAVKLRMEDKNKKVLVTGCLSQRYRAQLKTEIPEIDAIFGTEDVKDIISYLGDNHFDADTIYHMRKLSTPHHYAYVKIAEGCSHTCAFCAIPQIRGAYRSRKIEEILYEAEILANKGVQEIILVCQDSSNYGKDIYGKQKITDLLERLAGMQLFKWIRPLYWYPSNFPKRFIYLMNKFSSIIPYVDMPIQHASDQVLRLMRRGETKNSLRNLCKFIREIRPDCVLRTTLIIGHPGETEDDFKQLQEFITEIRFDRIGTFIYSDEEGTASYAMENKVKHPVALRRREQIMALQQKISGEKNKKLQNTIQTVLIDEYDSSNKCYIGRTYRDAPEIDNEIIIHDEYYRPESIGKFTKVKIFDSSEYELYGEFVVTNRK